MSEAIERELTLNEIAIFQEGLCPSCKQLLIYTPMYRLRFLRRAQKVKDYWTCAKCLLVWEVRNGGKVE